MQTVLNKIPVIVFKTAVCADGDEFFGGNMRSFAGYVVATRRGRIFFIFKRQSFLSAIGTDSPRMFIFGNLFFKFKHGLLYLFNILSRHNYIKSIFGESTKFSKIIKHVHLCLSLFWLVVGSTIIRGNAFNNQGEERKGK